MKLKRSNKRIEDMTWEEFDQWRKTPYPVMDPKSISDIRPTDKLIPYYPDATEQAAHDYFKLLVPSCIALAEPEPIEFAVYENYEATFERFKNVFPNVTRKWANDTVTP